MKAFFLSVVLCLIGAGTASADYILIKIDVNKLNLFPTAPGVPGAQVGGEGGGPQPGGQQFGGQGGGAFMGGAGGPGNNNLPPFPKLGGGFAGFTGQPPPPPPDPNFQPNPGAPPPPMDDADAKWVSAVVQIKNITKTSAQIPNVGYIFGYEHPWSTKNNWLPYTPLFPWVSPPVSGDPFSTEFALRFAKEKNAAKTNKEKLDKRAIAENFLHLARWTLSRGKLDKFYKVMEEAEKVDKKHPVVENYLRIKKALDKPFAEDLAERDFLQKLLQTDYKTTVSKKGHYALYSPTQGADRSTDALIARRLALMEETLECFYYWFAVQKEGNNVTPALPKFRLAAILELNDEEFKTRHLQWGSVPMVGDGFAPRRDKVVVMSAKVRLNDPAYQEFERVFNAKLRNVNETLEQFKIAITREDLLSGKILDNKFLATQWSIYIAAAQTAALLSKTIEDRAERETVSHGAIRQLLIASEMFPRNVQIPDWMTEGLAAFFGSSIDSIYPTIGAPSWAHTVSFKHLRDKNLKVAPDVLYNVVTDRYFQYARNLAREAQDNPRNAELQRANKEAWETARCTSWALIFYLASKGKLDSVVNYGKELNKLPRDLDLNDTILENCFAEGFDMKDSQNARQIDPDKLESVAKKWFGMMQGVNLKPSDVQLFYEQERAKADDPAVGMSTTIGNSGPATNPPPGVSPFPPNTPPFQQPNAGFTPKQKNGGGMRPPASRNPNQIPGGIRPPNRPPIPAPVRRPGGG